MKVFKKAAGVNKNNLKRAVSRCKVMPHYSTASNNAADERNLFGRLEGCGECTPDLSEIKHPPSSGIQAGLPGN